MHDQKTRSILIVDDNPTNLSVLSQALKSAGLKFRVAVDGESALEAVEYQPPELILLDVQMPGIDGFETCSRLKENPCTKDIPIIFMTALTNTVDKVKGLSLGAVDYITKPFEHEEVLARVKVHLELSRLTQNLAQLNHDLEQRVTERTTQLEKTLDELKNTQMQLVQQEKMSTLGQLVAGVAHEINNPVGFIANNITPAQEYVRDLKNILTLYQQQFPDPGEEIVEEVEEVDLEFILDDLPQILKSMQLGAKRLSELSVSLRNFSRSDHDNKIEADLHEGLDSTLLILRHRLKATGERPEIQIIKEYGDLPQVNCYPGQLNQVFMNILANGVDALHEAWEIGKMVSKSPEITITTAMLTAETVVVQIADNGLGMAKEVREKIFQPMFTTKPVGKGTGLGLSITHKIVEEKHSGKLSCISNLGEGTKFVIELPVN